MAGIPLNAIIPWITQAALRHPQRLAAEVAARHGVGAPVARAALRRLVALQWLVREGSRGRPRYRPGALRQVVQRYALADLDPDAPWPQDFEPCLALPPAVARLAAHTLRELLANAAAHGAARHATVSVRQTPSHLQLLVSDDGIGLYACIARDHAIDDPDDAMLAFDRGGLAPPGPHGRRHAAGRGLYFVSRLADVFDLHANGSAYQRRAWEDRGWRPRPAMVQAGTSVYASFALDTRRDLEALRRSHALAAVTPCAATTPCDVGPMPPLPTAPARQPTRSTR